MMMQARVERERPRDRDELALPGLEALDRLAGRHVRLADGRELRRATALERAASTSPSAVRGSRPRKMFSATESVETSCSSCGITAIPAAIASRGVARRRDRAVQRGPRPRSSRDLAA